MEMRDKTSLVGVVGLIRAQLMIVVKQQDVVADNPMWQLSSGLAHLCMSAWASIGLANMSSMYELNKIKKLQILGMGTK
jgi:hypothetical protein